MDATERLLHEHACERLILEFARSLDLGEPGTVAELFAPEGVWEWPAGHRRIVGRAALRDYFAGRPTDRLSRRLMTNVLVEVASPELAHATSYFTTYRVDGWTSGFVTPVLPTNVGHYEDTFTHVDGQWLLARRTTFLAFGGDTPLVPGPGG